MEICKECAKEFQPRQKFCCKKCKSKNWVKNNRVRFNETMRAGRLKRIAKTQLTELKGGD